MCMSVNGAPAATTTGAPKRARRSPCPAGTGYAYKDCVKHPCFRSRGIRGRMESRAAREWRPRSLSTPARTPAEAGGQAALMLPPGPRPLRTDSAFRSDRREEPPHLAEALSLGPREERRSGEKRYSPHDPANVVADAAKQSSHDRTPRRREHLGPGSEQLHLRSGSCPSAKDRTSARYRTPRPCTHPYPPRTLGNPRPERVVRIGAPSSAEQACDRFAILRTPRTGSSPISCRRDRELSRLEGPHVGDAHVLNNCRGRPETPARTVAGGPSARR